MRVRRAEAGDVPAIAVVHVESWRSTYDGLVPGEVLASLSIEAREIAWREEMVESSAGCGVLVLKDESDVVGFCHYSPSRDDDAGPTVGEITSIYLRESSWRRGGGTLLLDRSLDALRAAGFSRATLWVLDENERARRFYEARGWKHDGEVKLDDRGTFRLRELRYSTTL